MPTFRIYNSSKILWNRDTIGRTINFWDKWITLPVNPPGSGRMTNGFGGRYLDFEEQMKKLNSPAIVIENLNPNNSPVKQQMMEAAGINLGYGVVKEVIEEEPQITITNASFK